MISAIKKLASPSGGRGGGPNAAGAGASNGSHALSDSSSTTTASSEGFRPMSSALQRKFGRGVDYNMKLLLRGDRASGKTCLLQRLQGGPFIENYDATEEIKVAAIQWNYKATDDVVKVEVWDVVDKGKRRIKLEGLKLHDSKDNGKNGGNVDVLEASLDAEFVDVYKGAHGVIFLFDVTKQWTFDYVTREVSKVPKGIPILVLGNFLDRAHHRCITKDQALGFVETVAEEMDIRYAESSMRNGFGLRYLHKFLSLPYLALQRQSLELQLEANKRDMEATRMELELYFHSPESDYDSFSEGLTKQRRRVADRAAPKPTADVVVGNKFQIPTTGCKSNGNKKANGEKSPPVSSDPANAAAAAAAAAAILPEARSSSDLGNESPSKASVDNVDTFVPSDTGGAIDFFLDDPSSTEEGITKRTSGKNEALGEVESDDDDTDGGGGNPMVASINEDVDLEEMDGGITGDSKKEEYEVL